MHRTLVWFESVWVVGVQRKGFSPVLQDNARSIHDHARTKELVDAADK
ncbi:hypothetical protein ES703_112838 [subsurface metagenome]